jgi:hypothetical protein
MSCKGNCGSQTCGFGKRISAFGSGADAFFNKSFTGPSNLQNIGACLKTGIYNNKAPLVRFGNVKKTNNGPMKIKSKK